MGTNLGDVLTELEAAGVAMPDGPIVRRKVARAERAVRSLRAMASEAVVHGDGAQASILEVQAELLQAKLVLELKEDRP